MNSIAGWRQRQCLSSFDLRSSLMLNIRWNIFHFNHQSTRFLAAALNSPSPDMSMKRKNITKDSNIKNWKPVFSEWSSEFFNNFFSFFFCCCCRPLSSALEITFSSTTTQEERMDGRVEEWKSLKGKRSWPSFWKNERKQNMEEPKTKANEKKRSIKVEFERHDTVSQWDRVVWIQNGWRKKCLRMQVNCLS